MDVPEARGRIRIVETPEGRVRRLELNRRQEIRSNYLVPLYVMWTPDVPEREAQAGLMGVVDAVRASGQDRQVVNFGSRTFSNGPYGSPEWYVAEAKRRQGFQRDRGYGDQIVASNMVGLFTEEPWQEQPHWEVSIVNTDLTDYGQNGLLNFVFGVTRPDFAASVQSVTRLIHEVPPGPLREAMVRRLLRHEVGHMFGLTGRSYNVEEKLGRHCTNICTMRQGMSVPEWGALTAQELEKGIHFCNDCMHELEQSRNRFQTLQ